MSKSLQFTVIDDDPIANMITSRLIKIYLPDISVEAFTDAREALDVMSGPPKTGCHRTIVFLDIDMPGLDGWQFLDTFKTQLNAGVNFLAFIFFPPPSTIVTRNGQVRILA